MRYSSQPPLLRICRLVRREGLPVFYGRNTFFSTLQSYGISQAAQWLTMLGADNLARVGQVILRSTTPCDLSCRNHNLLAAVAKLASTDLPKMAFIIEPCPWESLSFCSSPSVLAQYEKAITETCNAAFQLGYHWRDKKSLEYPSFWSAMHKWCGGNETTWKCAMDLNTTMTFTFDGSVQEGGLTIAGLEPIELKG
jgi:hypothetical protein